MKKRSSCQNKKLYSKNHTKSFFAKSSYNIGSNYWLKVQCHNRRKHTKPLQNIKKVYVIFIQCTCVVDRSKSTKQLHRDFNTVGVAIAKESTDKHCTY